MPAPSPLPQSERPRLEECVPVPGGAYRLGDGGERVVRVDELLIGRWPDASWGVRAARALAADPERPTATTGFRIAIDCPGQGNGGHRRLR